MDAISHLPKIVWIIEGNVVRQFLHALGEFDARSK
jgi:hypothetical protein